MTAVTIKKLSKQDSDQFIAVIKLFEEVFEMENFSIPQSNHLQRLLSRSDFFVFVALLDNKVVGGLTAYVLEQYYSEKPLAYIYDLAVEIVHQRQGIGRKLIAGINDYCDKEGFEEVFVQADKVDDYAIDFYRATQTRRGRRSDAFLLFTRQVAADFQRERRASATNALVRLTAVMRIKSKT